MHLRRICLDISNFGLRNGISRIRIRELASEEISQLLIDWFLTIFYLSLLFWMWTQLSRVTIHTCSGTVQSHRKMYCSVDPEIKWIWSLSTLYFHPPKANFLVNISDFKRRPCLHTIYMIYYIMYSGPHSYIRKNKFHSKVGASRK